jgi:hypothetical protein
VTHPPSPQLHEDSPEIRVHLLLAEKVFANSPNMLVLCLTVIGLVKIYTRFERITTLADNFLAFVCIGYLIATIVSYLALRNQREGKGVKLAKLADIFFLFSLCSTAALAIFIAYGLEG